MAQKPMRAEENQVGTLAKSRPWGEVNQRAYMHKCLTHGHSSMGKARGLGECEVEGHWGKKRTLVVLSTIKTFFFLK